MITREQITTEAAWILERLSSNASDNSRNYYQGRLDSLAWLLRQLGDA